MILIYSLRNYPQDLHRKVNLFKHFWNCLEPEEKNKAEENNEFLEYDKSLLAVYVKRWAKVENAGIYRLSNRLVQVSFKDKTDIVMNAEKKRVIYSNSKKEISVHPLIAAMENADPEVTSHLKNAKALLNKMMNSNNAIE
eukprot:TRINITY_DN1135_c0_g3_i2.p3 TRINITY_DN1135_c0_g3~~TRINITY_DN1135_c0_g3_i2.p3  ORF type:complete len:140 (+),score=35.83 TRINITY_DN1135_c0_g3_i2:446-865(+)